MFPDAITPMDSLTGFGKGDVGPVWIMFALCAATTVNYVIIACWFLRLFGSREVTTSMVALFLLCAGSGFMPLLVAEFVNPNLGYTLKLTGVILLQPVCGAFFVFSRGTAFSVYRRRSLIGKQIEAAAALRNMPTEELIEHAERTLKKTEP